MTYPLSTQNENNVYVFSGYIWLSSTIKRGCAWDCYEVHGKELALLEVKISMSRCVQQIQGREHMDIQRLLEQGCGMSG